MDANSLDTSAQIEFATSESDTRFVAGGGAALMTDTPSGLSRQSTDHEGASLLFGTAAGTPLWQAPTGGGVPPYNPASPGSTYENTALNGNGWLGSDPATGQGTGSPDIGDYGRIGSSASLNQSAAAGQSAPQESWTAQVHAEINASQWAPAFQNIYNNATWLTNNINFGSPSTTNIEAGFVGLSQTDLNLATCVGGLGAAALAFYASGGSASALLAYGGLAVATLGLVGVVNACEQVITSMGGSASAVGDILHGSTVTIGTYGRVFGDFTGPAGDTVGAGGTATSGTNGMTPGFRPDITTLDKLKDFLTPAAKTEYFPNG